MNRFLNAIAITTTLILAQSCSLLLRDEGKPISAATHQYEEHSMGEINHREHSTSGAGDGKKAFTLAKLKVSSIITPNKSIPIVIDVQDSDGKAIANFDTFQEKLMHLILVSDDLQFFSHLHPTYKGNGQFEVATRFPQAGSYTFFSDYKPAGQTEQVSVLKTQVPGNSIAVPEIDLNRSKTFNDTKVNLTVSEPTVKAGKEVTLMFKLQDASNNQLLTDLQPYLGERGHLVILRQSTPLKAEDYIHAHALKDTPAGQVHFMTSFPQPGKYKLWGQFNRNGKIVTADFWINVV
ncbi:hypothetical protein [Nostoc sp. UIC 10630]|uniref:hypothetical protein n=1 Tax=Nostoc sp. UIC 10630 TaxID=2100146 RepID=UPI0013D84F69|nr:hypothetical protein [Nostoc sp. UIC 10630]NEU82412.1 hypothetical protein [Nostoc sp. UIC 10630]